MTEVMGFMSTTIVPLFREKLVPIIATLKEVLTKVVDEVKKFLIPIWEKLQPVLAKISWNFMVLKGRVQGFIRDVLVPLWNTIKWRVMVAMGQLSGFMRDVVGPAVDGLGKALQGDLGKALIVVAGAIMGVVVAMKIYQGAMAAYAIIMKAIQLPTIIFTALQAALNVVMSMNPIMLVVLAIAALVGAFIAAYTFIEPFRQAVDTVFGALMAFGKFIIDVLVGAFELFGKVIGRIGEGIMNSPFGLFLRLAIEVAKGIGGIIDSVFGGGDDKPKPLPAGSSGGTMFPGLATVGQPAGTGSATFGGIPPAQTTVNVTLDGKAVAQSVDTRIGRGAGSGGRNQ
jgi:phage-related protein